ncbi:MAG: 5-formyltetrahydrofolate cyclo-ligase [Polyangiaceae bacterium]
MDVDEKALAIRVKKQLRARFRRLRETTPSAAAGAAQRSAAICDRVIELPAWQTAQAIALFSPMPDKGEVDVSPLDQRARSQGKRVAYPFMRPSADGYTTGFAWVDALSALEERGRGFAEPPPDAVVVQPGELDAILVPALAVAPSGHRLGFGIGWYDATLSEFRDSATLVLVAFDFQLLVELPIEEHDVPCHVVVTDERLIVPS